LLFRDYIGTGKIHFGRFILRRGFKIWPALYVFLLVMALFLLAGQSRFPAAGFIHSALFIGNYFPVASGPYVIAHTWSLGVEEHFYLFLPLLLLLLTKSRWREPFALIPLIFCVIAATCLALRIALRPVESYASHFRIDSLFAGVTLGYWFHFRPEWFKRISGHYALGVAAVFLSPLFIFDWLSRPMQTFGLSSLYIGFAFLLAWAVDRKPPRLLKPVAMVGFYSYSIYLWQQPVSMIFHARATQSWVWFWLYIATAVVVGMGMAKLIEIPFLRLREKWAPTSTIQRERTAVRCRDEHPVIAGESALPSES
jgi:peptidoglycan/LPS O-acetylase OafA/YrhL